MKEKEKMNRKNKKIRKEKQKWYEEKKKSKKETCMYINTRY